MAQEPECHPDVQGLILAQVIEKSRLIVQQQRKADTVGFKSYGGAQGLQTLRHDRKSLQARLRKPTLISFNSEVPEYGPPERPKRKRNWKSS